MPLPKKGERKDDYLQRCMADAEMDKYDPEQRYAVCNSYWKEEKLRGIFSNNPKTIYHEGSNKQN